MDKRILGIWNLISYKHIRNNAEEFHPFGQQVIGILQYHEDYYMSVEFARAGRPLLTTDILYAPKDQIVEMSRDYFSYSGTFELASEEIIMHKVEICIFPNWIGTVQKRHFHFAENDENTLILQSHQQQKDEEISHLVWRKRL